MSEFCNNRSIKAARADHRCEACGGVIPVGGPAKYFAGKYDGIFYDCYYHVECRAAEIALNDCHDTYGDDWIALSMIRDEPEDVVWLIAEHPLVAARMGFKPAEVS